MTHHNITLAAALALTAGTLAAASASEATASGPARNAITVPTVLGAAYHVPGIALSVVDVRSQGGLLVPNLTRWQRTPEPTTLAEPFKAPATFTVAYRNPRIATDAAQVLRQGGFATAGVVRWSPDATVTVEVNSGAVKLGSL